MWLAPVPSADQLVPFHLAMRLAGAPPAVVNVPPTYRSGPPPSSNTVSALTKVVPTPPPIEDQLVPSHFAMRFADAPPAVVNAPAAISSGPPPSSNTASAFAVLFNPLPTFHCFGLTAGALLPLLGGMKSVLHPSPLQTKLIPKRVEDTGATILFATDTFLNQYIRACQGNELGKLRFAVCGAERVVVLLGAITHPRDPRAAVGTAPVTDGTTGRDDGPVGLAPSREFGTP